MAVLDVGFEKWAAAKAGGELPSTSGTPPGTLIAARGRAPTFRYA